MANELWCYHSHPPVPDPLRDLAAGADASAVVVCIHPFGVGVYLPADAAFGHIDVPHLARPGLTSMLNYPRIGESIAVRVAGYSGHQLRLIERTD